MRALTLFAALALVSSAALAVQGKAVAVLPDGSFGDWKKASKPFVDPAGDAGDSLLDLGKLRLANDDDALYLQLEVGGERLLQNGPTAPLGNALRLYIDADKKRGTGLPVEGLGAELEIRFGEQEVIRYDRAGNPSSELPGLGTVMGFPTFSSDRFEIRVAMPADERPKKKKRRRVRLVLREEVPGGDRLPDVGTLLYKYPKTKRVKPTKPRSLGRRDADAIRILSFNVERSTIVARQELYGRLLRALAPDILAFQEITDWTAQQTAEFIAAALPPPASGEWQSFQVFDTVVVTAFPMRAATSIDANQVVHIDLPDDKTPHDLVLFNAHPPCCDNDAERDQEIDRLMETWRELLAGSGPFAIAPQDAVVLTGDFNLVGFRRQFEALKDGVFTDPSKGRFSPGRDEGSLELVTPRHTHRRMAYTWRRDGSSFYPGRLDYMFYSGDVAKVDKSFILDTASMSEEALAAHALELDDSVTASDHLPLVVDYVFAKE